MSSPVYRVEDLHFSYRLEGQEIEALRGVSILIEPGSFTCLSGPSGSGKTTLLNLLGLIEKVQRGQLFFGQESFAQMDDERMNEIRRFKLGFVFQSFQLFPVLRADENVEYFLARQGLSSRERSNRVRQALEAVGLWEHRRKRPLEMSGGQRQRVAIARAIAKNPEVIIADEPTASLDQKTGREIMDIFRTLNQQRGVTILISSHDPMVHSFVPRRVLMNDGRIDHAV